MLILALALAVALPTLKSGGTVTLGPGPYDMIVLRGERFNPPVTINAGTTVINGLRIWDSRGIIWRGGIIKAPAGRDGHGPTVYGADIRKSDGLTFDGTTFTEALRGAVVADSNNITVRNARFTGLRSDGINLAGNNNVLIENNRFDDFTPVKPTGTKAGGDWKDGDHPDAIQLWNTPTTHSGTNIVIRGNVIDGDTQGINFFGKRYDGYSRVTVENNDIRITYPAAISVFQCDECTVRNNKVASVPGSKFRANVRFEDTKGEMCGNTMKAVPSHAAAKRC